MALSVRPVRLVRRRLVSLARRLGLLQSHDLRVERDRLVAERDEVAAERDELTIQRDRLVAERDRVAAELERFRTWMPPGHFYSPIPALDEVRRNEARIFGPMPSSVPGVDLNEAEQLDLVERLGAFYAEMPFAAGRTPGLRYFFDNPNFSYADAIVLYAMVRHLRPRRIIEVGSGYSSCVLLDTNERFFGDAIACTFIERHPELLLSLLTEADRARVEIVPARLQEVDPARFAALGEGDILFVDSTHVAKVDSDVNYLFAEILPRLASGVRVHFHDVFHPFEYPREWVYEGRAWNEAYVLRAFLQYNEAFRVCLFTSYLAHLHPDALFGAMPLCRENSGGSIWLRRL